MAFNIENENANNARSATIEFTIKLLKWNILILWIFEFYLKSDVFFTMKRGVNQMYYHEATWTYGCGLISNALT